MSVIIACPSCGGKLRVADELRGQPVRCPKCNHTFTSEPAASAAGWVSDPAANAAGSPLNPQDLPLQLSLDEPSGPPLAPANGTPGLVGAVELDRSPDQPSAPPPAPEPPRRAPPRLADVNDDDGDMWDIRRRAPRRDAEPDRGATVLTLGIISLACLMISCFPIGTILGLIAWIMGQRDLRKIKRGAMDENGQGMTQAGWICGILGTLLNGLVMLGCLSFIGIMWFAESNRPLPTRPVTPPVQKWQPKGPLKKF